MSSNLIRVKATAPHMRGQRIAGVGGLVYWIHPQTGLLHEAVGNSTSPDPGVDRASAARFRQFAGFEVEKRPPPAPVRTPASSGSETSSDLPDSDAAASGSLDASSEAPEPEAQAAIQLPSDDNEWSIKVWLKNASDLGIALTADEAATRPKADLVNLIRAKAAELSATK
jgi:hypothetical protein